MPTKFKADPLGTLPTPAPTVALTDRFGRGIMRGTVITYPNRRSSSMWIMDAIVERVITTLQFGLPVVTIVATPIREMTGSNARTGWALRSPRKVRITRIERVTVIPGVFARRTGSTYSVYNQ